MDPILRRLIRLASRLAEEKAMSGMIVSFNRRGKWCIHYIILSLPLSILALLARI